MKREELRRRGWLTARVLLAFLLAAPCGASAQRTDKEAQALIGKPVKELIADFVSEDWGLKVSPAEKALESREGVSAPELVGMLDSDRRVELTNTFDLIYPGAKTFYGHGRILDYDVDWLSVRAGWALEKLTFNDFGFSGGQIKKSDLLQATLKGKRDVPLGDVIKPAAGPDELTRRRAEAVRKAKEWWAAAGPSWNRFDELLKALRGDSRARQLSALQWLRNGETRCEGLNVESYNRLILPEVKRLSASSDEGVRTEAGYLLKDKDGWWYKYKFRFERPEGWNEIEFK